MKKSYKSGHCLCGEVTYEYEADSEIFMGHCHCESCRRATSSPLTSFFGVPNGKWRWTGLPPKTHETPDGVTRSFCALCGSPMAYQTSRLPDEIHFFAATLDDQSDFKPEANYHMHEMVHWVSGFEQLRED